MTVSDSGFGLTEEQHPVIPRILVVEDDAEIRALIRRSLGQSFDVTEAANAEEAVLLLDEAQPDLVLLDWRLPGKWGSEVLDVFAQRRPRLPIIVLTSQRDTPTRLLAETLGADLFMTKPFRPAELIDAVRLLLRGSE